MTLKFDRWPRKIIENICHVPKSYVSHLIAIHEFKLDLQSRNAQNRRFFCPCDLEIWWMTSKSNTSPLRCSAKLCVSFHSHLRIQTGVTVRKRSILVKTVNSLARGALKFEWWPWKTIVIIRKCSIWVKIVDFSARVTLIFDGWPWKTIQHLFYTTSSFVRHFVGSCESKLELRSGNAQIGANLFWPLWPWPSTSDFDLLHWHQW